MIFPRVWDFASQRIIMIEYFLLVYILLTAGSIYVLLFGQSEFHRNGLVGKIHTLMVDKAPDFLRSAVRCLLPHSLSTKIFGWGDYVLNKKNPILAIAYVLLVLIGYVVFFYFGRNYLPNRYVTIYHMYVGHAFVWFTLGWYFYLVFGDSGVITAENVKSHLLKYRYDGFIYGTAECRVCKLPKPPRSKHCYTCGVCVARFDHHCPWINGAHNDSRLIHHIHNVGAKNLWKFLAYLLLTALLCSYASILTFATVKSIIDDAGYLTRQFPDKHGNMRWVPYRMIFEWIIAYHGPLFSLWLFTTVIAITMYCFFGYQLWLTIQNTTTYESHKWSDIRDHVRAKDRLRKLGKLPPIPKDLPPGPKRVQDLTEADLVNIYDRGFKNNLSEVFYYDEWTGMEGTAVNIDVFYNKPQVEASSSPVNDSSTDKTAVSPQPKNNGAKKRK